MHKWRLAEHKYFQMIFERLGYFHLTTNTKVWFLFFSHKLEEEFELLKKSEVLYYSVEKKGNVSSQFKHHNPWSMKCHQQQLKRMKENAKHRNQYSILCANKCMTTEQEPHYRRNWIVKYQMWQVTQTGTFRPNLCFSALADGSDYNVLFSAVGIQALT